MSSITPSDRQAIVSLCEKHHDTYHRKSDFRQCITYKSYFIKYDSHKSLRFQYETQKYIYNMTLNDPHAPRVPEVIDYFVVDGRMAYLVMEFIDATSPADDAYEKVAAAVQWLSEVQVPPDVVIGSVGGGPASHKLFKDHEAPLLFSSKHALEAYMNRALEWLPRPLSPDIHKPAPINFTTDKLFFTQSDMDKSNFMLDKNGKVCMIDFEAVVVLPESLACYTLHATWDPFVRKVGECLDWTQSPNRKSMGRAGEILHMSSDRTLGLDKDGHFRASS
ncbi:hypothetical protein BD410DRAFT_902013 [Rickenella mellea]|uniref:Aminoglycoside phosphotransferase domain-containing protein n=1 Tax=Rickenella mellea TaxID=50990 RepID=A0A4Y7PNR1_9AGAM|nr:hypothetical protein BD410DRAFT_902013 [Rickenella mellea]